MVAVVVVVVVVGKGSIVRTAGAFVTHLMPDLCQSGVHWLRSPIECHVSEVDLKPLTPPLSPPPHPIPSQPHSAYLYLRSIQSPHRPRYLYPPFPVPPSHTAHCSITPPTWLRSLKSALCRSPLQAWERCYPLSGARAGLARHSCSRGHC